MADFDVIVASGATLVDWLDPGLVSAPSRLNSRPGYPQKRYRAGAGQMVILKAVVGGVVAPLDATLGGRLFSGFVVDAPLAAMPFMGITSPFGQSSIQAVLPVVVGHYTFGVRRPSGGIQHVHLDIG